MIRADLARVKGKQKSAGDAAGASMEACTPYYTVNDSPQPQVAFAFGFENTKPLPLSPLV